MRRKTLLTTALRQRELNSVKADPVQMGCPKPYDFQHFIGDFLLQSCVSDLNYWWRSDHFFRRYQRYCWKMSHYGLLIKMSCQSILQEFLGSWSWRVWLPKFIYIFLSKDSTSLVKSFTKIRAVVSLRQTYRQTPKTSSLAESNG